MKCSVFVGVSVDGFLARLDGTLDFLPESPEPHGYEEFYASVDAIVIGRNTYEFVHGFGEWPYGKKRVIVLTTRPLDEPNAERMEGDPAEIAAKLEASGVRHAYIDGGDTVQRFLRAGLIDRLVVTRVPVLIGTGISLFGAVDSDIALRHVATRTYPSGLVQSEYDVVR